MSKFKALTGNTPPSFSGDATEEKAQQSKPSVSLDNTPTSTQTTKPPSMPMLSGVTTDEKTRQHAMILKVALSQLLKAGLVKRYKVLYADGTTVKELQIVFDPAIWTESLELR